jgi:hypothetical protein
MTAIDLHRLDYRWCGAASRVLTAMTIVRAAEQVLGECLGEFEIADRAYAMGMAARISAAEEMVEPWPAQNLDLHPFDD